MLFTCYFSSIELMSQANWILFLVKGHENRLLFTTISSKNGNSALLRLFICLNQCGLHRVYRYTAFPYAMQNIQAYLTDTYAIIVFT